MTETATEAMDPDELARACAAKMAETDSSQAGMGIELVEVGAGRSVLRMKVAPWMVNGYLLCHGGLIFTLADSAFAYACNTYNRQTVAQMCNITFVTPAKQGDVLTARAQEKARFGRSGVYDVTVTDQDGRTIAEFRGNSRNLPGPILDAPAPAGA